MADVKKMTLNIDGPTALDPKAEAKFASPGVPGRVVNIDGETDGGGVVEVLLKHPDGTIEQKATVPVPKLAASEKCAIQIRVSTNIRNQSKVAEVE